MIGRARFALSIARLVRASFVCALFEAGCSSSAAEPSKPPEIVPPKITAVIRADTNRDGVIDDADEEGKKTFSAERGAIFLANIDDDLHVCPSARTLSDVDLAACNDALNDVIDGDDDLLDLAPMRVLPIAAAPADATGSIHFSAPVRVFRNTAAGWVVQPSDAVIEHDAVVSGFDLAIEAKDIVRDPAQWNGAVDVFYRVKGSTVDVSDQVALRVAPLLLQHHGQPVERLFATKLSDAGATAMRTDLRAAFPKLEDLAVPGGDPWTQDFFEAGYMSMPAKGGQHAIRVVVRSANKGDTMKATLRVGGRVVFSLFRGKDVAGIQEFNPSADPSMDSLNSFGNTETIPPHAGFPLGRIIRGSTPAYHPDAFMARMFEAQELQKPLLIDTSWLLVGHVDETLSFLPGKTGPGASGFLLMANDPRLAKAMLEGLVAKGHGTALMFEGKNFLDDMGNEIPGQKSVAEVLADADVMAQSQKAAAAIDGQLMTVREATGLTDDRIVHVPFLHMKSMGGSIAYQPGTVNGVLLDDKHFASPAPHGPIVDGADPFKTQLETALGAHGVTVSWVEDWDEYHRLEGEVHCGSNVFREIPSTPWWVTR